LKKNHETALSHLDDALTASHGPPLATLRLWPPGLCARIRTKLSDDIRKEVGKEGLPEETPVMDLSVAAVG
jgi:hypothetical protein